MCTFNATFNRNKRILSEKNEYSFQSKLNFIIIQKVIKINANLDKRKIHRN